MMLEKIKAELTGLTNLVDPVIPKDRSYYVFHALVRQHVLKMQAYVAEIEQSAELSTHGQDAPGEPELRVLIRSIARHEIELVLKQNAKPSIAGAPLSPEDDGYGKGIAYGVGLDRLPTGEPVEHPPTPAPFPMLPLPDHPRFREWSHTPLVMDKNATIIQFEISRGIWVDVANLDRYNLEAAYEIAASWVSIEGMIKWQIYYFAEKDKRA